MLTNALRILINNLFKKSFLGKEKKIINVLTAFFIFHKSNVKIFLKLIINQCPKTKLIKLKQNWLIQCNNIG